MHTDWNVRPRSRLIIRGSEQISRQETLYFIEILDQNWFRTRELDRLLEIRNGVDWSSEGQISSEDMSWNFEKKFSLSVVHIPPYGMLNLSWRDSRGLVFGTGATGCYLNRDHLGQKAIWGTPFFLAYEERRNMWFQTFFSSPYYSWHRFRIKIPVEQETELCKDLAWLGFLRLWSSCLKVLNKRNGHDIFPRNNPVV